MNIPKIFHHIWFGNEIPDILLECRQSFNHISDGWELKVWNEKHFTDTEWEIDVKEIIDTGKYRLACEVARLLVLRRFGGFYLDHDIWAINSFNSLLGIPDFVYSVHPGGGHMGATGVIGCRPENELLIKAAEETLRTERWSMFSLIATETGFPPLQNRDIFYPWYHTENPEDKYRKTPESVCTHLWLRAGIEYDIEKLKEMQHPQEV